MKPRYKSITNYDLLALEHKIIAELYDEAPDSETLTAQIEGVRMTIDRLLDRFFEDSWEEDER